MRAGKRNSFWSGLVWLSLVGLLGSGELSAAGDKKQVGQKAGETRTDNGLKMTLVWCPPGKFTMGSPKTEGDRSGTEDQVKATLPKGFWLGKTEVTQDQWEAVMGTTPWKDQNRVKKGSNYPATFVSWEDAIAFCKKLTVQERAAGRLPDDWEYTLPTETQWECACRAGTTTAYSFGENPKRLVDYAWYGGSYVGGKIPLSIPNDERYAHKVGQKKPNAWGLFDMHGNVSEWCQNRYSDKLPGWPGPRLVATNLRTQRGGGWDDLPKGCRSASRVGSHPSNEWYNSGFRVAQVPCQRSEKIPNK